MKRSIVGIVAVFCIQLGFIAYSRLDHPVDQASVSAVSVTRSMPAQLEPETDSIVVVRTGGPAVEKPAADRRRAPAVRAVAQTNRPWKPIRAQNLTATYARPGERPRTEYRQPVPQKRSFVAKAIPVIKKPYDWVKAVAGIFK